MLKVVHDFVPIIFDSFFPKPMDCRNDNINGKKKRIRQAATDVMRTTDLLSSKINKKIFLYAMEWNSHSFEIDI